MSTETQTEMLGGTRIIPIEVPTDMVASSGPWDEDAAYYGTDPRKLEPKPT